MPRASPLSLPPCRLGVAVLAGGRSKRMGRDKASLPWPREAGPGRGNDVTLLAATVARVRQGIGDGPIVCVAAQGQSLPPLPGEVEIVRDREPDRGPLEGLACGLEALTGRAELAFACGCDTPLLEPKLVTLLAERIGDNDACVPVVNGKRQPLLAVYRVTAAVAARRLQSEGRASLQSLLDFVHVVDADEDCILSIDREMRSLVNCNDVAAYRHACEKT